MNVSEDELAEAVSQVLAHYYEGEVEHQATTGPGPHILDHLETLKRWLEDREGGGDGGGGRPGGLDGGGGGGVGIPTNRILSYAESVVDNLLK